MSYYITTDETEMALVREADDALCGYPLKGFHAGGGRHAPISTTPGLGWTLHAEDPIEAVEGGDWAYPVRGEELADEVVRRGGHPSLIARLKAPVELPDRFKRIAPALREEQARVIS